ncbi:MAG: hypothetical protein AAFP99_00975 [Pseudomonadota bacterium]
MAPSIVPARGRGIAHKPNGTCDACPLGVHGTFFAINDQYAYQQRNHMVSSWVSSIVRHRL